MFKVLRPPSCVTEMGKTRGLASDGRMVVDAIDDAHRIVEITYLGRFAIGA